MFTAFTGQKIMPLTCANVGAAGCGWSGRRRAGVVTPGVVTVGDARFGTPDGGH